MLNEGWGLLAGRERRITGAPFDSYAFPILPVSLFQLARHSGGEAAKCSLATEIENIRTVYNQRLRCACQPVPYLIGFRDLRVSAVERSY